MPKNSSKKKKKKKSSGGSRKKGQAAGDAGRGPSRQAKETLEENKKELLSYINTIQQVAISPTSANWTTWNRITDISKNVENIVRLQRKLSKNKGDHADAGGGDRERPWRVPRVVDEEHGPNGTGSGKGAVDAALRMQMKAAEERYQMEDPR